MDFGTGRAKVEGIHTAIEIANNGARRIASNKLVKRLGKIIAVVGSIEIAVNTNITGNDQKASRCTWMAQVELPDTVWVLAPACGGRKGKVERGSVAQRLKIVKEQRGRATRRYQLSPELSQVRIHDIETELDPLHSETCSIGGRQCLRQRDIRTGLRIGPSEAERQALLVGCGRLPLPCTGKPHRRSDIELPKTHLAVKDQSAAIEICRAVYGGAFPRRDGSGDRKDFLNIPVTKVRIGLQHQSDRTRDQRRSKGRSRSVSESGRTRLKAVRGPYTDARCRDQQVGSGIGKKRGLPAGIVRADGDNLPCVGQVMEVCVVTDIDAILFQLAVSGSKDDGCA